MCDARTIFAMRRIGIISILVFSLVLNVAFAWAEWRTAGISSALQSYSLPLLSKRIFASQPNDLIINFTHLRSELRSMIAQRQDLRVGLYFEYLPSGVSIGVNDQEPFISASLLKTPFIMGLMHNIENGFLNEDAMITLDDEDLDSSFGNLWRKGAGYKLTVGEAIQIALAESDNTAVRALNKLSTEDLVVEVYEALDIPLTVEEGAGLVLTTPKSYASVFRCLYLSCFLTFDSSHKILSVLASSIFHDGLAEGIPHNVPFSHKVGVFNPSDASKILRLDCGIAYLPKRPYLLCVFIEGDKDRVRDMLAFAREISARIYRYVSETDALSVQD